MPQQFVDPLAKDAGVADPAAKDYEAPSIAGDFGKGVKQGIHSAKGAGYGLIALVGDATGAEGVKNYGLQGAMRESAAAEETAPSVSRIEDVNSVGDFAHYAAGGVGSLVPFAATSAAGGGIGGLGARMLGRKAAERMVEQAIASGVERSAAEKMAGAAAAKTVERGAIGGAAASSVGTEQGIIEGQTYQETGKTAPGAAAGYGLAAGLVDVIPEARIIQQVVGKQGEKAAAKGLLRNVGEQGALGAGTEAVQTVLENKGTEAADPTHKAFSEEGTSDIVNSAIIGGLGQALTAGVGHGIGRMRRPVADPVSGSTAAGEIAPPASAAAEAVPPSTGAAVPTPDELAAARAGVVPPSDPIPAQAQSEAAPQTAPSEPIAAQIAPSEPTPPAPGDWRAQRMQQAGNTVAALQTPEAPARPWNDPNAGALTKAVGIAVESGVTPDPYTPAPSEAHPERADVTNPPDLQMQNRDRSRPASIAQMNTIANNPDYDRLGVGKSPNEAAPMVSVGANAPVIAETDFGKSSRVVMGDGSKIGVRYAVVEADSVLASHNVDGTTNGDYYAAPQPGTIRALNNGRVAGLQAAYQRGTAEAYRQALLEHAAEHGVPPEAIEAKKNPVLVRVYDDAENQRPNIGALSNPQSNLNLSAAEQAHNDAERLDVAALTPDEHGDVLGGSNMKPLRQFLDAIPKDEHNNLVTKGGGFTKQFGDRVRAALFARAYGNPELVSAATEEGDPDVKNVLHAFTAAAPAFAQVDHGGHLDIRPAMVEAFNLIREGKRKGMKPAEIAAQGELQGRDPMTQMLTGFMIENTRSPRRMAAAFTEAARFMQNEAQAATTGDMFGRAPATPADLAGAINRHLEQEHGPESQLRVAEAAGDVTEKAAERTAQGRGGAVSAPARDGGQSGQQQRAPAEAASAQVNEAVAKVAQSGALKKLPETARETLLSLYREAAQRKDDFDARVRTIADALGGDVMLAPLKGAQRAVEKIVSDYRGDAAKIKDLLRATILVSSPDDARAAVERIKQQFDVLPAGQRNLFAADADPIDGYRDAKLNVRIGDVVAEVQVNMPAMVEAKKQAHVYYERRAKLERKFQDAGRDPSAVERSVIGKLNRLQKALYDKAYAEALTSARKSDSEIGAPLRRADAGSKARGASPSQAAANKPGTPAPSDTGMPSTSKNSAPAGNSEGRGERAIDTPIIGAKSRNSEPETTKGKRPALDLAAQTEAQAQADRAKQAKAEADARAKDQAPAPADFALTGSERKADANPAQADLFAAAHETVQKAVDKLPERADATPAVRSARDKALRELTQAGRLSVLAARINLDMIRDGAANLIGRTVTSMYDLAAVAQVYRDPRFETLRYVFVKNGKIVHETAISSRLPATAAAFPNGLGGTIGEFKWLADLKQRTGADGYYLLHNHPTGNPDPSAADVGLTLQVKVVRGFLGHVVIDTNTFGTIDRDGKVEILSAPEFKGAQPRVDTDTRFGFLGAVLASSEQLARMAKRMESEGSVSLVGLDVNSSTSALAELPVSAFEKPTPRLFGTLSRFQRAAGLGGGLVLLNLPDTPAVRATATTLIERGLARVAHFESGNRLESNNRAKMRNLGRAATPARVVEYVAQEQSDLFGDDKAVQAARDTMRAQIRKDAPQLDLFGSTQLDNAGAPADNGGKAPHENTGKVRGDRSKEPQGAGSGALFQPGGERPAGGTPGAAKPGGDGGDLEAQGRPGAPGERPGVGAGPGGAQPDTGHAPDQGSGNGGSGAGRVPRPKPYQVPDRPGLNFRITRPETIGTGGDKEKYRANVAAIALLKQIESENRQATPAEQETLSRYVGWGGLKNAFFTGSASMLKDLHEEGTIRANHHAEIGQAPEWAKERRELLGLLTADEYDLARGSTPNAHYTAPQVISAMWDAMAHLGFGNGRVLEPAMGVGHFYGLMPDAMRNASTLAGVELDAISGRIAKQLYQKADIRVTGFETAQFPDGFFDVAISNVPFGDYKVNDPKFNKYALYIHDYFFMKALDRVRPGGVVAFITSDGTLDKLNSKARKLMAQRAEFLGAIRLPNDAFKKNAGTEVTTDIVFLRRREKPDMNPRVDWTETKDVMTADGPVRINAWYADHKDMMLGTMGRKGSMYGAADAALVSDGRDLTAALREAIAQLPKDAFKPTDAPKVFSEPIAAPDELKPGALFVKGGKVFQKTSGMAMMQPHLPVAKVERIVAIRDAARAHLRGQLESEDQAAFDATAKALSDAYDGFVKAHGFLNVKANAAVILEDSDAPLLLALEKWNPDTGTASKADIFTQRTVHKPAPVTSADSAPEALVVSLNERGRVDLAHMAAITGLTQAELIGGLDGRIYHEPIGREWQSAEEYLSGNVRQKLRDATEAAKTDPRYGANVEALKAVQPVDLAPEQIRVRLGQSWVPTAVIHQFAMDLFGVRNEHALTVAYSPTTTDWKVTNRGVDITKPEVSKVWGTPDVSGVSVLEAALNQQKPTVYVTDEHGDRVKAPERTAAVAEKVDLMRAEFERWWMADETRKATLTRFYNDEFNTLRLRQYDGAHLSLPGSSPLVKLRQNVKDGAWRIVSGGNTLLAHAVGAGKTFTAIAGSMELKRLGLRQKPMHVVPNHMLEQYSREWLQLYPNANLLLARKEDLATADGRKLLTAKIATGNWDGIVITHSSFERVGMSEQYVRDYIQERIRAIEEAILEEKAGDAKGDPRLLKRLEKRKKDMQARLTKMVAMAKKDGVMQFEELGVDQLFVDEAHYFKNLGFDSKMERIAGISDSDSQRATDMFLKTQYVTQLNNQKGGVVFMTGTPISNSVTEMFTMQRYLGMRSLRESHLDQFDAWAAQYGEAVTTYEMRADGGGYAPKTRFAKFVNMGELAQAFGAFADVKTAEMLKLPVPALRTGKPIPVTSPMTDTMKSFVADLVARADRIRMGAVDPSVDNMLKITSDGRKAALDMRLVDPAAPDLPDSKVNKAVGTLYDVWKQSTPTRAAQLVFLDMSTPKAGGKFSVYTDIKKKLVARGVPASEIAFIQDANTDAKKDALFQGVKEGRVRVLLGSTDKMGAGTNVQKNLIALHHLDVPWRPSDIEQRNGRIIRQGNQNAEVGVFHYITEGSFDTFMWQTVERKAGFIAQAMNADPTVREIEEVGQHVLTYAELKAYASGNPLVLEKANVDGELARLSSSMARHQQQQSDLRRQAVQLEQQAGAIERYATDADKDQARLKDTSGKAFNIILADQPYNDRVEAANALAGAISRAPKGEPGSSVTTPIGTFAGFDIAVLRKALYLGLSTVNEIHVRGANTYNAELGESADGNLQRLENLARSIAGEGARQRLRVTEIRERAQTARAEAEKPYPHADKVAKLLERQREIDKALGIGKDDPQAAAAVDGGNAAPAPAAEPVTPSQVEQTIMPLNLSNGLREGFNNAAADLFTTQRTFNAWWHKAVGTQFHKAQVVPEFRPVYESAQRFVNDTARLANETADQAPDLLPKLSGVREVFKLGPALRDIKAVAAPLFEGTLTQKREFDEAELRDRYRLTPKQVALYQQARATINRSLELLSQTEMARLARGHVDQAVIDAALKDTHHGGMTRLREALSVRAAQATTEPERAFYSGLSGDLWIKYGKVRELIREGYAPLMRFGQYTVDVVGADGERKYFGMFESQAEANAMARALREEFRGDTVTQGVLSKEAYKMFRGLTPDTMELFAEALGLDQHEAFQEFARRAVNNRSTLKRLIERKGIAGFDQDVQRVLAAFATSNSRAASSNLNAKAMNDAVQAIPKEKGDVKDEAVKLVTYLRDPQEEAANLRGFLFVNFLGGSVASALVNMTQPFMMTLPYLSQFGATRAAAALTLGMKEAVTKPADAVVQAALARAEREGTVSPHEIHQLYAESIRGLGQNIYLRKGLKVWGSAFSLAEQFNRRSTFIAAFRVAQQMTPAELERAGFTNAYDFAVHAIAETQGVYNRGNRPNWGRGAIGATVMTFKQFTIAYLELLKRLPPRERALMLSLLVLASGVSGLPFADDLDDLIDTIAQAMGFNWNTKQAKRAFLTRTLGQGMGEFVLHGVSTLPGVPLDIQGRLSVGNVIPGTGLLKKSDTDKTRDITELLGPVGGVLKNAGAAFSDVEAKQFGKAGREFAPKALQDVAKAIDMVQSGYFTDAKGRRVLATDTTDAVVKGIGFNPSKVAQESRRMGEAQQNIDLAKATQDSIATRWAQGLFENDPAKVKDAMADLRDWNGKNPESRIQITPATVARRVKEMQATREQRFVQAAPKGMRPSVRQDLAK
jgi:N12 class adenine-specific DNA methylase